MEELEDINATREKAYGIAMSEIGSGGTGTMIKDSYTKVAIPCPRLNDTILAKGLSAARVLLSRKVPDRVVDERMEICTKCEHSSIYENEVYCDCCPCPHWNKARLKTKNRHRAHSCPADPPKFGEWKPCVV